MLGHYFKKLLSWKEVHSIELWIFLPVWFQRNYVKLWKGWWGISGRLSNFYWCLFSLSFNFLQEPFNIKLCCCSVAKSCTTLCNTMDCSMPGFPVYHQLPELAQTHVIRTVMPSNHLILCCPLLLLPSLFPSIRVFSNESLLLIRWPKYWSFNSTPVLPMNIQDWSPLGWTGCSPRDLQEFSPTPQFKTINSLALSFLYSPTLTSIHDYWKNHSLD